MEDPCSWVYNTGATPHIDDDDDAYEICQRAEDLRYGPSECSDMADEILNMMEDGRMWTQNMAPGVYAQIAYGTNQSNTEIYMNFNELGGTETENTLLHEMYHYYWQSWGGTNETAAENYAQGDPCGG